MTQQDSDFLSMVQSLKEYAVEVRRDKRLVSPTARTVAVQSRPCGSRLTLDVDICNGRVVDVGYQVRACSLGQATTAIFSRRAIGMNLKEIENVAIQLEKVLKGQPLKADELKWPELSIFSHAVGFPSRHGSALLPFDAIRVVVKKEGIHLR